MNAGEWEGYVSATQRAEQAESECARLRDELERLRRLVPTGTYTLNVQYEEEIQRLKDVGEVLVRSLERMTRERDDALQLAYRGEHRFPDASWKAECERMCLDIVSLRERNEELNRDANNLQRYLNFAAEERDQARAELAFIHAEYAEANESDLTRDALCLRAANLRLLADKAAGEQGIAQRHMMEAQEERNRMRDALRAAEKRELEALAELDEAKHAIRLVIEADCLKSHAFERGDDDASVYELCKSVVSKP